jgi:hypothetical protein
MDKIHLVVGYHEDGDNLQVTQSAGKWLLKDESAPWNYKRK